MEYNLLQSTRYSSFSCQQMSGIVIQMKNGLKLERKKIKITQLIKSFETTSCFMVIVVGLFIGFCLSILQMNVLPKCR